MRILLLVSAIFVMSVMALLLDIMLRSERRRESREKLRAGQDETPARPPTPANQTAHLPPGALQARRLAITWQDGPSVTKTPLSEMADAAVRELFQAERLWERARPLADEPGRIRIDADLETASAALAATLSDAMTERARFAAADLETQRRFIESKHR